ncbi:hypothetical protein PG985_013196 [Apiospora marii]
MRPPIEEIGCLFQNGRTRLGILTTGIPDQDCGGQTSHLEAPILFVSNDYLVHRVEASSVDSVLTGAQTAKDSQQAYYFLHKSFSWGPFDITLDLLNTLLNTESVFLGYNTLIKAFSRRSKDSKTAQLVFQTEITYEPQDPSSLSCYELCYNVQHVEKNNRGRGNPWSVRQMGVYSKIVPGTNRHRWIFIDFAKAAQTLMEKTQPESAYRRGLSSTEALNLHVSFLHSLTLNWSEYLEYLSCDLDILVSANIQEAETCTCVPKSNLPPQDEKAANSNADESCDIDYSVKFEDCQNLHKLITKLRTVHRALQCCQDLGKALRASWQSIDQKEYNAAWVRDLDHSRLLVYGTTIASHTKSVKSILERANRVSELLLKIIEIRIADKAYKTSRVIERSAVALEASNAENNQTNKSLAEMQQESHKDSITLKALTIIATVYLPASLCATVFSSNLVQSLENSKANYEGTHFVLATDFWVFAVLTLGMMVATVTLFLAVQAALKRPFAHRLSLRA